MGTNTNTDALISALAAEYNFLPEHSAEKRIAQIMLCHISQLPHLTLEEAAALCHVSESTFARFCKHMGYDSFSAFKSKIAAVLENYPYQPQHFRGRSVSSSAAFKQDIQQAVQTDMERFWESFEPHSYDRLAEAMHRASNIYFHDTVYSTVRLLLQSDLAVDHKMVTFSPNNIQQRKDVQTAPPGSLFLFMYDGHVRSKEMLPCVQYLQRHKSAIITAFFSPIDDLSVIGDCDFFFKLPQGSASLTALMMHDLVYEYLSILYREKYLYTHDGSD